MSRLTGNEVKNLMEAYSEVYVSQEISEDQIWEEVEEWVNSLVEEGHDLSEYTWEDMYEAYIEEQGSRSSRGVSDPAVRARWSQIGRNIMYGQSGKPTPNKPTARQLMRQKIQSNRPGVSAAKPAPTPAAKPAPTPAPTPAAKPAAAAPKPVARPAAAPAAKPTATAPKPTATPKPTTPAAAPAAKKPSLASQTAELRKMRAASQARQAGANVVGSQMASFDIFDLIKGHLLDEGYADTDEAALGIMANMSEEWKQSIINQ